MLNILTIGGARSVFSDKSNPTLLRYKEYSKRIGNHWNICYTPPGYIRTILDEKLEIFPTNSRNKFFFLPDALRIGLKIIHKQKPDVIISQDTFIFGLAGLLLKKITGIPLVVHYHSGFITNQYWIHEKRYNRLLYWLGLFVSRMADGIRTVSTDIRNDLIRMRFDSNRIFYATPPVSSKGFLTEDKEEVKKIITKFQLNPDQTFIFIGRLSKEKNIPLMLSATKKISKDYPDLKLILIGKGPEEKNLRKIVNREHIEDKIIFVGEVPNDEINNYIKATSALLVTSYYEGTAKVIKEAAFSGRTTISTKTSGVSDAIIDSVTGLIVPINDEISLINAMILLLDNPEKASIMGENAKQFVLKKFNHDNDIERIVEVWQKIANFKK